MTDELENEWKYTSLALENALKMYDVNHLFTFTKGESEIYRSAMFLSPVLLCAILF